MVRGQRTQPTLTADIYADVIDHTRFDSLWRASKKFGRLDTKAVVSEAYLTYVAALSTADPEPYFVNSRLAFWINAYLASLMHVMHFRIGYRSSIWDSTLLTRDTFIIAKASFTLRSLADTIVATARTVRARAFLCTGSSYAPPYPTGASFGKSVIVQMRDQLRRVLRNDKFIFYDPAGNTLQISVALESWLDGMTREAGGVVEFIIPWVAESTAAQLALNREGMKVIVADRVERWMRAR